MTTTDTTETTDPTPAPTFYRAPMAPMILSREDCAAMRKTSRYVVRLEGHTARLELKREAKIKAADGFARTSVDLTRTIAGEAGTLTRATFVELYAGGSWQALARLVRAGDVLRFYAADDNSNGYLQAAIIPAGAMESSYHGAGYPRLYVDELRVDVVRKDRAIVRGLLLTYSICPQNSARAVEGVR
jgi:hypothetical protein